MNIPLVRLIIVSSLVTTLLVSLLVISTAVGYGSSALAIGAVSISPSPAIVNQPVTVTIQLDNYNYAMDHGKTVKLTVDPYASQDLAISNDGTASFTFTPDHVGSYTYKVDKVSQSEADKFGSFVVVNGLSFRSLASLPVDGDGNILALADGYSRVTLVAAAMKDDGSIDRSVSYSMDVNGVDTPFFKDSKGQAYINIGPYGGSDLTPIEITASADGYGSKTLHIRFIKGSIQISTNVSGSPPIVMPGSMIEVTATLKDNGSLLRDTPVVFREIMSNGTNVLQTLYTDDNGQIVVDCSVGLKAGNNIFTIQLKGLSLVNTFNVRSVSSDLADFTISTLPSDKVIANGNSRHKIIVQITDAYGNNIKDSVGVNVRFTNEYGSTYTTQPNSRGVAYAWSDPSVFPGRLNYTIVVDMGSSNITKDYTVYYVVDVPEDMAMDAYPDTIASSNVRNSNITYPMNQATIVTRIVDNYGNPVAFQPINLTVVNASQGTLTATDGYTDAGGEFSSVFKLASDLTGSGDVLIRGACGATLKYNLTLKYTEDSHLNVSTDVDPRQVKPGDIVNVTVRVDGVGWDNGRPPADIMLVMDRSGSMGDAIGFTNYAANDNGGWFAPTIIDSSTNPVPRGTTLNLTYNHDKATRMLLKVSQAAPPYPKANARYITDDIPSSMIAGQSYTVHVTYQNTGDVIWSESNVTRLADQIATVNFASSNRAKMASGEKVLNGSEYTFTFTMTAPMVYSVTNYNVRYNMLWDGYSGWFGDNVTHTITVNPDPSKMPNAQFISSTIPSNMTCGEFYNVSVTFMNTGNIEWNSLTKVRLIYYGGDNPYFWLTSSYPDYRLFYIPTDVSVKNGETFTFNFTMRGTITSTNRTFTNAWYRMYSDIYGYFGQQYTQKINVTINPPALPNAAMTEISIPTVMIAGQTYNCNITLRNTGGIPWTSLNGSMRLYLRGDNTAFRSGLNDYIYIPSNAFVNNGDTFTFNFTMKAPAVTMTTDYTNAWFMMYMDYSYGPWGYGWFGSSNPVYTYPKITVLPVPRAPSTIYGDWYTYKLLSPTGTSLVGNPDADRESNLANPNWASTIKVVPAFAGNTSYVPTTNSSGTWLSNFSYAPLGTYTLQITNTYVYPTAPEVAYKVWIWDNMKMGQRSDQDAMAKLAAKNFVDPNSNPRNIYPADRVGLVTFGTDATMDLPLKYMTGVNISSGNFANPGLKETISTINSYGETNTAEALKLAVDQFEANPNPNNNATRNIILLTDGYSTSTAAENELQVQRIIDNNITVYAIGIADDESKVDSAFLKDLSEIRTNGRYFFVKDLTGLQEVFTIIGQIFKEKITDQSSIDVKIEQTNGVDNTDYVPGSAYIVMNNSAASRKQVEPTINGNTMSWVVDPIKLGYNWTLTYKVRAAASFKGFTHPVGEGSVGHFVFDGKTTDSNFMSEPIYVNDNNVSSSDMIRLNITMPEEGTDLMNSTFDMRWNVTYNATPLTYSQIIAYAPAGTDNYVQFASGFASSTSDQYRYLVDLDKLNIKPGEYTFKIYATDGLFEAYDVRNLTVVYEHGPKGYITIGSNP